MYSDDLYMPANSGIADSCLAETQEGEGFYVLFEDTIFISFPTEEMRNAFYEQNKDSYSLLKLPEVPSDGYPELYYHCLRCPQCKIDDGFLSRAVVCTDAPSTEIFWAEWDEASYASVFRLYSLCQHQNLMEHNAF